VRVRYAWIESRRADLFWYIGSPLFVLAYLPVAWAVSRWTAVDGGTSRFRLAVGAETVPVTAGMVVLVSWALLLDGPHFWPTLARTVLDPQEWRERGAVLRRSFLLFLLGPAVVLTPWVAAGLAGRSAPPGLADSGARVLLVGFLGWAYWHVCRQHWGFVRIYRRRAGESDPSDDRVDRWFFHVALFVPPALLLTHPAYPSFRAWFPQHGLHGVGVGGTTVAAVAHAALWVVWSANLIAYVVWQARRARRGAALNGPKLLLLVAVIPVHLAAFAHPAAALFSQVIVGVGHAVQYQRIVWRFGRNRYGGPHAPALARRLFASPWLYFAAGLAFTLALLRGPWVDGLVARGGAVLDAWMAGIFHATPGPTGRSVGAAVVWGLFLGWLFQHYYLDAKIWKVRDRRVRRDLGLDERAA